MSKCTQPEVDTMTPTELSREIAEAMGWKKPHELGYKDLPDWFWYRSEKDKWVRAVESPFNPLRNWHHFGMVYEWMRGEGWNSSHGQPDNDNTHTWIWWKGKLRNRTYQWVPADAPDIRRAMLLAALEAEGKRR